MNKEWVEQKNQEYADKINRIMLYIEPAIENSPMLDEKDKQKVLKYIRDKEYYLASTFITLAYICYIKTEKYEVLRKWCLDVGDKLREVSDYKYYKNRYNAYLDSDPMEFDGDIIITDPCYIMRAKHHGTIPITEDDWDTCNCGYDMEALGINHYMTRGTLYGDWSCTTINTDTKEKIGNFCADAGLVSVFLLDEVLKYNPDYNDHIEYSHCVTLIKDFKGTVQFVVKETRYVYDHDTEYHKVGDVIIDYAVEVVGHGINKVTGEPINFRGFQSGF